MRLKVLEVIICCFALKSPPSLGNGPCEVKVDGESKKNEMK